jgi:hypothetical protein
MSSNYSKPRSARSRTIFKKRNGAYIVARDEGKVTRICWLHVVKGDPLNNLVAEPGRARDVFEAAITDVTDATATAEVATITGMAAITEVAAITHVVAIADVIEDAHDLPGLRNDVTDYDWSMTRILKDALER